MSTLATSFHLFFDHRTVPRFLAYLALWMVLIQFSWANFAVGVLAAACATWISVQLLPVSNLKFSPTAFVRYAMHLSWQSLVAGADVARRALDPRMPLQPGFITYASRFESGPVCDAFRALVSLQPGTLAVSGDCEALLIHCLDTSQPIAASLAAEEALLMLVTGGGRTRPACDD